MCSCFVCFSCLILCFEVFLVIYFITFNIRVLCLCIITYLLPYLLTYHTLYWVTVTNVLLACTFVVCSNKLYCIVRDTSPLKLLNGFGWNFAHGRRSVPDATSPSSHGPARGAQDVIASLWQPLFRNGSSKRLPPFVLSGLCKNNLPTLICSRASPEELKAWKSTMGR